MIKKIAQPQKMPRKKPQKNKHSGTNTLRIIGGEWRSRKLSFVDAQGLRPTPDRVRETLFNWLQGSIHGANCLDLFAGSGVLGLEALSRGANQVTFVEKNRAVANQLQANLTVLKSDSKVQNIDALDYLKNIRSGGKTGKRGGGVLSTDDIEKKLHTRSVEPFNIVFLDPPYRQGLLEKVLIILCDKESEMINEDTLFYIEHESEEIFNGDEFGLKVLKQTSAGQVKCYLMSVG